MSTAPASITTGDIYRGIIPFVGLQVAAIAILWMVPQLATWLPKVVFPDPVAVVGDSPTRSVFDDIMQGKPTGAPTTPSGSPLDQLLNQPPAAAPASDPVLDRLMKRD